MSATNRGAVRHAQDFYVTPTWLIEAIIPVLRRYRCDCILEPAAGDGRIVRVLQKAFPDARIDSGDIATDQDFLDPKNYLPVYDLIITNPPYSAAQPFIERALQLRNTPFSVVCMLLRVDFLGAQKRAAWVRKNFPAIWVSPRRPSFTGNSNTDATEYAWMVWDGLPHAGGLLATEAGANQLALNLITESVGGRHA